MIDNLELIIQLNDNDRDILRKTLHRLFSSSFIIRGISKDEELYSFVIRNRDAVEAYCECAGWTLRVDETLGVISWKGPSPARFLLSKDETIMLVVIRLIYEEKKNEISLHDFPVTTVEEIHEKYKTITSNTLRKTRIQDIFRRLSSLKLINAPGSGNVNYDSLIILYPSLAFALDSTAVDSLMEKITTDSAVSLPAEDDEVEETDVDQIE